MCRALSFLETFFEPGKFTLVFRIFLLPEGLLLDLGAVTSAGVGFRLYGLCHFLVLLTKIRSLVRCINILRKSS